MDSKLDEATAKVKAAREEKAGSRRRQFLVQESSGHVRRPRLPKSAPRRLGSHRICQTEPEASAVSGEGAKREGWILIPTHICARKRDRDSQERYMSLCANFERMFNKAAYSDSNPAGTGYL